MKWPRGKHNGQRIAGFSVKLRVNVSWGVQWLPRARWNFGQPVLSWLVFWLHFEPLYFLE